MSQRMRFDVKLLTAKNSHRLLKETKFDCWWENFSFISLLCGIFYDLFVFRMNLLKSKFSVKTFLPVYFLQ